MTREFETIQADINGDVLNIVLGREDVYNAVNAELFGELKEAIIWGGHNDDVRVIVIEGQGDNFSSGGDMDHLKERLENPSEEWRDKLLHKYGHLQTILDCPKPIIAKVEGYATGAGSVLATICDITVMSTEARIGDLHVKIGYSAPDAPAFWPLLVGVNKTKELMMTAELLDGEKAEELGLVNYAVPPEELDDKVDDLVDQLASSSQPAIQFSKLMTNKWLKWSLLFIGSDAAGHEAITGHLPDHEHAVNAFLDDEPRNFPSARDAEIKPGSDDN